MSRAFYEFSFFVFAVIVSSYFVVLWIYMKLGIRRPINNHESSDLISLSFVKFWNSFPDRFKIWLSHENKRLYELPVTEFYIKPFIHRNYQDDQELQKYRPYFGGDTYTCFQDFFAREFKQTPIIESEHCLPCQGLLCDNLTFSEERSVNVKGENIGLRDIFGESGKDIPSGHSFLNVFLSNRNYHHIHSPVSGTVKKVERISGNLIVLRPWYYGNNPSKPAFLNERVNIDVQDSNGDTWYLSVVGGPVVNSILTTDSSVVGQTVKVGEKLATFELGSTCCIASPVKLSKERLSTVDVFEGLA